MSSKWDANGRNIVVIDASSVGSVAITPNDGADLPKAPTRGLYVGMGGDIKMTMDDGSIVTRKAVTAGMTHPWAVRRVWANGTTAGDLLGDY